MGLSAEQLRALQQIEAALYAEDPELIREFTAGAKVLADREQGRRRNNGGYRRECRVETAAAIFCVAFMVACAFWLVVLALG